MTGQGTLEFRLLGPLEARLDDQLLPLGGARQRALLALLLLRPNELVARDRLIEELWRDHAPESAANALAALVARLRRVLPGDVLVTGSGGYEARIDPDALDLHRFERLAEDGSRALAAGDSIQAAEHLHTALSLWRGPPLADLAYEPFAESTIRRLEELRLSVLENRIDADLALGRHGDVVGELQTLVSEHPLRERLRGQLMLALYRAGRQADALETYADGRRTLRDELGLEPSADLQTKQKRILQHDPALAARPKASGHGAEPWPLPAYPDRFVGRERELARLLQLLSERRLITVLGPGGIGKTRTALEAARRYTPRAERVHFVPLASTAPDQLLPAIATALAVGERPGATLTDTVVEHLNEREIVLMLDNLEHLAEAAATQIGHLLAACPELHVVATSRVALRIAGEQQYPLAPLGLPKPGSDVSATQDSDAVALFLDRARAHLPGFSLTTANAGAIAQICERLDGLPLAIELAAAHMRLFSPDELLTRLNSRFTLLTRRSRDLPARHQTLRAAIDWSYDLLPVEAQEALPRLSVFRGGFHVETAEAVCDVTAETLDTLIDHSLLQIAADHGAVRLSMLETIREYAAGKLATETELQGRHAHHYARTAADLERKGDAGGWATAIEAWVQAEEANALAAFAFLSSREEYDAAADLIVLLSEPWRHRGHIQRANGFLRELTNRPLSDAHRADVLSSSASISFSQGDVARALTLSEEAVALARPLNDRKHLAFALSCRSAALGASGDIVGADHCSEELEMLSRASELAAFRAIALINLASGAFVRRDFDRAIPLYEEAKDLIAAHDTSIAYPLVYLAIAAQVQGRDDEALRYYGEALDAAVAIGWVEPLVDALEGIAVIAGVDDPNAARVILAASAAERERTGVTKRGFAQDLDSLASTQDLLSALGASDIADVTTTRPVGLEKAVELALEWVRRRAA